MSKQDKEKKVLTEALDIEKAERLSMRVAFSIYYRKASIVQHEEELKAIEKVKRFLTSDTNKGYLEKSGIWKKLATDLSKQYEEYTNAIKSAKDVDNAETTFLETIKEHTYGENQYDHDYFKTIFVYADVNGDTDEYTWQLKALMKEHGFIKEEKKDVEEVTAEPIEEENKE